RLALLNFPGSKSSRHPDMKELVGAHRFAFIVVDVAETQRRLETCVSSLAATTDRPAFRKAKLGQFTPDPLSSQYLVETGRISHDEMCLMSIDVAGSIA